MIQVHIRIPDEVLDMIEQIVDGRSRTDKVEKYIASQYIGKEYLNLEKQKCLARLKSIEENLAKNPFSNINVLSEAEKEFILGTIKTIDNNPERWKNNPEFLRARTNQFNKDFVRNMVPKEFELLIYKVKDELTTK